MGSWGVKAHESDRGLDYLGLIKTNMLKPTGYTSFNVAEAMEYLKKHIIDGIRHDNRPYTKKEINELKKEFGNTFNFLNLSTEECSEEEMQEYIDDNFPISYSDVVILMAECLADFFKKGKYLVYDYDADKKIVITNFIYTAHDLNTLITELQKIIDPKSVYENVYDSWAESESLKKWKSHIKRLCKVLEHELSNITNKAGDDS